MYSPHIYLCRTAVHLPAIRNPQSAIRKMQSLFSKLILLAKNPLHNFSSPAILYLEFAGELLQLRMTWSKPFEPDGAKTLVGSKNVRKRMKGPSTAACSGFLFPARKGYYGFKGNTE